MIREQAENIALQRIYQFSEVTGDLIGHCEG